MKNKMMQSRMNIRPRWMIVDNNNEMLSLIQDIFARFRNVVDVTCFNSPQEALAAFETNPRAYDLVITDLEMPDLSDEELCRRLRAFSPALKILLSTASDILSNEEAVQKGFCVSCRQSFPAARLRAALEPATFSFAGDQFVREEDATVVCAN